MCCRSYKRKTSRFRALKQRNIEIWLLHQKVMYTFGYDACNKLPDWDKMLYEDTKELTLRNYVELDEIINMN